MLSRRFASSFLTFFITLALVVGVASTAVAHDHGDAEEVGDYDSAAAAYDIDAVHSSVVFRIKHLDVGYVYGMFRGFEGDFKFDEDNPENSEVNFTIETDSVFTNVEDRDDHLRSPDFFAAEEHPELTFESTSVEEYHSDDAYEVTGDLTIRGTTEEISFVADEVGQGEGMEGEFRRGFETTFAVNRMDYGVDFMPDGLGETVRVTIAFQGIEHEENGDDHDDEDHDDEE